MCCFCDCCIQKFNKKYGYSFDRTALIDALNEGDITLRKAWLNQNSDAICNILKAIADSVYAVNPNITLGFMSGERYLEGYQFEKFAYALSDGGKHDISWRPGGGAYNDYNFDVIVTKSEEIGRQTAYLPPFVTLIQSELESFPHQLIKKTPTSTAIESAWAIASGCTGTAFNILPTESLEPISCAEEHLNAIKKTLPFYRLLSQKIGGKQPIGIHTGWRTDSQASAVKGNFVEYPTGFHVAFAHEVFDLGLPQCYNAKNAQVVFLKGQLVSTWSDEEILDALSKGVYMDADALAIVNERGFSDLTGFSKGKKIPVDASELYAEHRLNINFVGKKRNSRQAFNPGDSFSIQKTNDSAEILSSLTDYHGNILADCCLGIFENRLGGRICVSGYYPYTWLSDYNKSTLLKRIMLYLSKDSITSFVDDYYRLRNHTFIVDEKIFVALLNPSNQLIENVKIKVKTDKLLGGYYTQDCSYFNLSAQKTEQGDNYHLFTVKEIAPYQMVLLEI